LQPDPIGYAAGDLNLYSYVGNDGGNLTDPMGLEPGLGGGAGAMGSSGGGPGGAGGGNLNTPWTWNYPQNGQTWNIVPATPPYFGTGTYPTPLFGPAPQPIPGTGIDFPPQVNFSNPYSLFGPLVTFPFGDGLIPGTLSQPNLNIPTLINPYPAATPLAPGAWNQNQPAVQYNPNVMEELPQGTTNPFREVPPVGGPISPYRTFSGLS